MQPNIFGKTIEELQQICDEAGFPRFAARQISDWMYKKHVLTFDAMSNLSLLQRQFLSDSFIIQPLKTIEKRKSTDGTIKYLFQTENGAFAESVFIPDKERNTLCISVQTGCPLGCEFCQTGKSGIGDNLSTGDIVSQVLHLPQVNLLTNVVIMGMGEPLLNWENVKNALLILTSPKYHGMGKHRITLSTVGIIPALKEFLQLYPCELAISLHTPFSDERRKIMPIENKYPIEEVLHLVRRYTSGSSRIVSFEYLVFKDMNHSAEHVEQLSEILSGIPCKINLMSFHAIEGVDLQSPSRNEMEDFQNALKLKGFTVTIRKSRGRDIEAACGMLAGKIAQKKTSN